MAGFQAALSDLAAWERSYRQTGRISENFERGMCYIGSNGSFQLYGIIHMVLRLLKQRIVAGGCNVLRLLFFAIVFSSEHFVP